ncbi:hypothetical protein [Streptomyces sp. NPDC001546]|uniref:hypothetical protein n=1 Tax=Streptomyces sp. NPDC001546 TaxID=3364585 RepID=UPI00369EA429
MSTRGSRPRPEATLAVLLRRRAVWGLAVTRGLAITRGRAARPAPERPDRRPRPA